eukprot:365348-Chlamydomonas_euryale.AAC.5
MSVWVQGYETWVGMAMARKASRRQAYNILARDLCSPSGKVHAGQFVLPSSTASWGRSQYPCACMSSMASFDLSLGTQ